MNQRYMFLSMFFRITLLLIFLLGMVSTAFPQFKADIEGDVKIAGRLDLEKGSHNTFAGFGAGIANSSGEQNAFFGTRTGFLNQAGSYNSFFGYEAGRNNYSGAQNTAIGRFALADNRTNGKNIAIGSGALLSMEFGYGNDPVAANQDLGTTYNLAIGVQAGLFTNDSTRIGAERNTFVGNNSGLYNTAGYRNAFFGFQAGNGNVTGDFNTCIGHEADVSSNNLNNAGAFGNNAVVNASNKIRIGDGNVTTVEGNGWSLPSDGRFKNHVQENVPGLDFLMLLRPVTYQFDYLRFSQHTQPGFKLRQLIASKKDQQDFSRASALIQTGFIAQEVEEAAVNLGFDFNAVIKPKNLHDNYGLSYSLFVVPIIKAIQEQQEIIESLNMEVETLQKKIANYDKQFAIINAKLDLEDGIKETALVQVDSQLSN